MNSLEALREDKLWLATCRLAKTVIAFLKDCEISRAKELEETVMAIPHTAAEAHLSASSPERSDKLNQLIEEARTVEEILNECVFSGQTDLKKIIFRAFFRLEQVREQAFYEIHEEQEASLLIA